MIQGGFGFTTEFDDSVFSSKKTVQALKKIAERLRQVAMDEQFIEHTLVEKGSQEHMKISREEVMWLSEKLLKWSEEYDKGYIKRGDR